METQKSTLANETPGFWQHHVANFALNNVTKIQYCKDNNITYHRFLYWHDKFTNGTDSFIPIKFPGNNNLAVCTIEFSQGHRLVLHDSNILPQIISLLK